MNKTQWIIEKFDNAISDVLGSSYVENHRKFRNYDDNRWEHLRFAIINSFVYDLGSDESKKVLKAAYKYSEENGLVDFTDPKIVGEK